MTSVLNSRTAFAGQALRPLAAVSLKTYLNHGETLRWCRRVRESATDSLGMVDLLVIPMATALVPVQTLIGGSAIELGAQDCSWTPPGAYTGEVPAEALRDVGVRVVEVGHAERRALFGETDEIVARKVARAVEVGLVPLVCVGERERVSSERASELCVRQLSAALALVDATAPVLAAYEPVWAIGAAEPAPPEHVRPVCRTLSGLLRERGERSRVLYGGTAGPGLFAALYPDVAGLFLGRRAHDVGALVDVMQEMARVAGGRPPVS